MTGEQETNDEREHRHHRRKKRQRRKRRTRQDPGLTDPGRGERIFLFLLMAFAGLAAIGAVGWGLWLLVDWVLNARMR